MTGRAGVDLPEGHALAVAPAPPRRRGPRPRPGAVAVLGGLVIGLQIAWPIAGAARSGVTVAVVVLFAATSVLHAVVTRGRRTAVLVLAASAGIGFLAEVVGVHTGVPFGQYRYSGTLGVEVAGVPVLVALAWTMFTWPAVVVAQRLGRTYPQRVAVAAWSLASWDLFLDPQMVDAGHWRWAHPAPHLPGVPTVPLTNLLGWLLVATVLSAVVLALVERTGRPGPHDDRWPLALYLWTYFSSVLALAAFLGLAAAAAWGALAMAPPVVALIAPAVRSTRRHAPAVAGRAA